MLGILLLILKIIGLVLLGIVCLLLALLLLVLFLPVPYRLQAEFGDRFTWRLRVFGIQVFPKKEKAGKKKRRKKNTADADERASSEKELPDRHTSDEPEGKESRNRRDVLRDTDGTGKPPDVEKPSVPQEFSEEEQSAREEHTGSGETPDEAAGQENREENSVRGKEKRPGVRRFRKKKSEHQKPGQKKFKKKQSKDRKSGTKKPDKRKTKDRKFGKGKPGKKKPDKDKREKKSLDLELLRAKWELLRTELTDEGNRRAACHGFSEAAYILRHFGPRRVKADLAYSLADPAITGYATAALSLCPVVYKKSCGIIPDFESEKLYAKGWMDVRGHVRLIHPVCSGLRLLIDKDIRAIIKKVRKLK